MIFRIPLLVLILAVLLAPRAASAGQSAPAEPRYDPATVVELNVVVLESREVPSGGSLPGVHVTVLSGKENLDVYLAPTDFLKGFDFKLVRGDRIDVVGSRLKTAAGTVLLLAREVRRRSQTVYLRDSRGNPYWTAQTSAAA